MLAGGHLNQKNSRTVISKTVKTSDESWLTVWDSVLASSGAMSDLFPVHFGVRPQSHTSVKDSISSYFGTAITSFHISAKSSNMVWHFQSLHLAQTGTVSDCILDQSKIVKTSYHQHTKVQSWSELFSIFRSGHFIAQDSIKLTYGQVFLSLCLNFWNHGLKPFLA